MGNAAEVSINRWGINLFWMKNWFADNSFQLFFQKSIFMEKFLRTFFLYGMQFGSPQWKERIWNGQSDRDLRQESTFRDKYFRFVSIRDEVALTTQLYRFRITKPKIYFSKLWFLRYQNWVILALHYFQVRKAPLSKTRDESLTALGLESLNSKRTSSSEIRRALLIWRLGGVINTSSDSHYSF
jgi:hypothetical protein